MKRLLNITMLLAFLCITSLSIFQPTKALADDSVLPQSVAAQAVEQAPAPSNGEKAVAVLKDVDSKIPAQIPSWLLGILSFLGSDVLIRVVPTAKPKSLLLLVGSVFALLGSIFTKLSGLADNLVQNVKDPNPPAV